MEEYHQGGMCMKKRPSITLLTVLLAMVFAAGIGVYSSYIGMKIYQESSDHLLESFSQISRPSRCSCSETGPY